MGEREHVEVAVIGAGQAGLAIGRFLARAGAHDDMEHDRVAGKLVVSTGR